jgi:hypothetical protein
VGRCGRCSSAAEAGPREGGRGHERSEQEDVGAAAAAALLRQKRASETAVGGRPPARKTLRTRPPELARTGAGEVGVALRSLANASVCGASLRSAGVARTRPSAALLCARLGWRERVRLRRFFTLGWGGANASVCGASLRSVGVALRSLANASVCGASLRSVGVALTRPSAALLRTRFARSPPPLTLPFFCARRYPLPPSVPVAFVQALANAFDPEAHDELIIWLAKNVKGGADRIVANKGLLDELFRHTFGVGGEHGEVAAKQARRGLAMYAPPPTL